MPHRPFSQYLNVRMAYGASFAPDGQTLAFLTDITGLPQVWTVAATGGWPHQRTFTTERAASVHYAPIGDRLLYSMDSGGNERMQLFLQEEGGSVETRLTDAAAVIHNFGGWSHDGQRIAFSSNERDPSFFDIYLLDTATGPAERVLTHDGPNYAAGWQPGDKALLIVRYFSNLHNQLLLLDLDGGTARPLTDAAREACYASPQWSADGCSLYVLSDADRDTRGLAQIDIQTATLQWLRTGPWDFERLSLSDDGRRLALVENVDGFSVLHICQVPSFEEFVLPTLPHGTILDLDWSHDGSRLAVTLSNAAQNADIWIIEVDEGTLHQVTHSSRAGIPQSSFVAPELIHFPTFDDRQIPAFYYRPDAAQDDLPVLVLVHGGPEAQFVPSFNTTVQYLVQCGYGVLAPNVRGSSGYGKAYTHLDDVRKRMDSVADLAHAVYWLREHGGADPARIGVMGGSYGGFMTLSAITTYPDLWSAAVCIVGIANFITFLENTGPWRRKLREAEYGSLEHDRDFLREISPIHHVGKISAPLIVIHGANDPRVPVEEAEQIVGSLRHREHPVEYLRFEDEGHGLVKLPNRIKAYTAVAEFLDRYLGGIG